MRTSEQRRLQFFRASATKAHFSEQRGTRSRQDPMVVMMITLVISLCCHFSGNKGAKLVTLSVFRLLKDPQPAPKCELIVWVHKDRLCLWIMQEESPASSLYPFSQA